MAFVTGTVATLADLLTAIRTACTDNGWTLSGNVLHKGTCFVEVAIGVAGHGETVIKISGGTGIDGSNALTGRTNQPAGELANSIIGAITWPVTYRVFINTAPDEVYVNLNYNVTRYETVGWGQSDMSGLVGTGNWYAGNRRWGYNGWPTANCRATGPAGYTSIYFLFAHTGNDGQYTSGVDHQLDSATWAVEGAHRDWAPIFWRQPNTWNSETTLIPIRVYASRPSGFVTPVLECRHARFINLEGLDDGAVITLGTDRWMVFPNHVRGVVNRASDSEPSTLGSSFMQGVALRYDGP